MDDEPRFRYVRRPGEYAYSVPLLQQELPKDERLERFERLLKSDVLRQLRALGYPRDAS